MTGSGFIYSWLGILLILPLPNQDRQHYTVEVGTIYTRLGILLILLLPNQDRQHYTVEVDIKLSIHG